jgi:two-component system, NarL family, sensor histidine kinase DesK
MSGANLNWSMITALRDWIARDPREGWREAGKPARGWRKLFDWDHTVWLVFVGFWCLTPYYNHQPLRYWLLLAVAVVLFIALYLLAHHGPPKFRWVWVLLMFLGALVYVPINESAWGMYIYIAVSLPEVARSTSGVIGLLIAQCVAMVAEGFLLQISAWTWTMGLGFTVLLGMNRLRMQQKHRADAKLRMAHEEIEHLAKTAERERIARDMHDVLGHSLSLIVLKSELARRLIEEQPSRAVQEIAEVEDTARQALAEVRKTISGYRSEGFASELNRAAQVLATAGVRFHPPEGAPFLTPRHEAMLSLVLREAITNIVRHADARECSVELSAGQNVTRMVVADDGCGGINQEGNGLRGMRERVRELGGSLSLDSQRGTRLQIELPQGDGAQA